MTAVGGLVGIGYERAINLDGLDRKVDDSPHRGMSGAEAIEGQAHPERCQLLERVDKPAGVGKDLFGDLEVEQLRRGSSASRSKPLTAETNPGWVTT